MWLGVDGDFLRRQASPRGAGWWKELVDLLERIIYYSTAAWGNTIAGNVKLFSATILTNWDLVNWNCFTRRCTEKEREMRWVWFLQSFPVEALRSCVTGFARAALKRPFCKQISVSICADPHRRAHHLLRQRLWINPQAIHTQTCLSRFKEHFEPQSSIARSERKPPIFVLLRGRISSKPKSG